MSKRKPVSVVEPRKEPKQERSRQTYQVILQGAAKIIRRDGIKKFSTNKVAEESGVSIGSLYQYFPSKEAIIAALIDQIFELEYSRLKELLSELSAEIGAREVLKKILSHYYHIDHEALQFRKAMVDSVAMVDKTEEAMRFHKQMAELLVNYIRENFRCEPSEANHATTIFMIQYMLRTTALSSVDPNLKNIDKEAMVDEIANIFVKFLRVLPEDWTAKN